MFRRLALQLALGLATLVGVIAAPASAQHATPAAPAPASARIVAVGDLHGDFVAWRQIASAAGLMDAKGAWTGGHTIFVQLGDVPDRGPDTLKIIADLRRLQKQAPRAGGQVVTLIGNHEAMNMTGDLRYVTPGEFQAFADSGSERLRELFYKSNRESIEETYRARGNPNMSPLEVRNTWMAATPLGKIEHQIAWDPKGDIGAWVANNPALVLIGDTIFVHGGLSTAYAKKSIAEINKNVRAALLERDSRPESIINNSKGPLWYRGLAQQPDAPVSPEELTASGEAGSITATPQTSSAVTGKLGEILAAQGATRMVIGHTPQLGGISMRHDNRLIIVDTGISAAYSGKVSWLEIIDGKPLPHDIPRALATATTGATAK